LNPESCLKRIDLVNERFWHLFKAMNEKVRIDLSKKLEEFDEAFEEAKRLFSIYSLLTVGVSFDDEEIDILNAQIIE
jgi:hypothetical protein